MIQPGQQNVDDGPDDTGLVSTENTHEGDNLLTAEQKEQLLLMKLRLRLYEIY